MKLTAIRYPVIAVLAGLATLVLASCSGTRLAYERAETLEAQAYVVSEHYAVLLQEANDIAEAGAPREIVARMQDADNAARPPILALRRAVETYSAVRNSENEAALQQALAEAAVAVSDFINAIREPFNGP